MSYACHRKGLLRGYMATFCKVQATYWGIVAALPVMIAGFPMS